MQNEIDILGRIIKEARNAAGLTRDELSAIIHRNPRYIASVENEGKTPSYKTLYKIIVALNIDPNRIFYPDLYTVNDEKARIIRMIDKCSDYELKIISATLNAILDKRE